MHIPTLLSLLLPLLAIPSTLAVDPNITVQDFIPTLDGSCSRSGHVNIIFAGEKFQRAMYQITYGQVKRCGGDTLSFKANGPQQMLNKQTNRFEGRYEATGSLTVFAKGGKKYKCVMSGLLDAKSSKPIFNVHRFQNSVDVSVKKAAGVTFKCNPV